jgi:protein MpaA
MLILGGLTGCAMASLEASTPPTALASVPPTHTNTPSNTPTVTDTSTPSLTPTDPPPTATRTPRPSATPTPSPTPLPQPFVIGTSVAGRPLEVYYFGEGPENRFIVAGIHGGYEWNTIALADALIAYLKENPAFIPEGITLYILRSANPDGEAREFGSDGRANENGVDINRNFPSNWVSEWNRTGCWNHRPITAGTHPGSEPEAGAVMRFVLSNQIRALISYHSAALGIFAGGQPPGPASTDLARTLAAVSPYKFPPPYNTGCEYTGQLADWAVLHNIPAVDVELTNHYDTDFEINLKILEAFLNWERP